MRAWTLLAAAIAACGAVIHVVAIVGGADWYAFFRAPPVVVESAREGTWVAPVCALVIAALMAVCACYALSAAGMMRRLPFSRAALFSIAALCLLRGLLVIPLAVKRPDLVDTFEVVAAIVWAFAGIGFAAGFRGMMRPDRKALTVNPTR